MELIVQKRDTFGKAVKTLRRQGLIPAELYGHGIKNKHLSVTLKDFRRLSKSVGENSLIEITLDGERHPVMIHDIATHPVNDEILSVDFYQVKLDENVKIKVPIEFIGESPAIKEKSGTLVKAMQDIEVEALPRDIPRSLEISLEELKAVGQSVYARDVLLPPRVKLLTHPETVVATVIQQAQEEIVGPEISVEAVKVETEEKKTERQAKKETAGETPRSEPEPKKQRP